MNILLNGEERQVPERTSIQQLLDLLGLPREHVAVEVNHEIVPKREHASRLLAGGDRVEIVSFVGGG